MNDDYLWDKSGPPDPEIKQLEEILGTLRYQPKPFEVPAPRRRSYFPLLAIAATLLIALLAGGIWLRVRTRDEVPPQQAAVPEKTPIVAPAVDEKTAPTPKPQKRLAPREQNAQLRPFVPKLPCRVLHSLETDRSVCLSGTSP